MKEDMKRVLFAIAAVLFGAFLAGCESIIEGWQMQAELQSGIAAPVVSRARVVAELREAQRLGLITTGEESVPQYTPTHLEMITKASDEAVAIEASTKPPR